MMEELEKDPGDVPHMSMESVGSIDFFKCNKCPYMALTAKDIQFHWQTSHSKNYKISDPKSITVKCPGCSGIFYSEISLKTHLRSHHKMCAKDINKLVQNLIQQFKRNQEYIENMEVVIDGHPDVNQNVPVLIEVPPDPKQLVIVNNNPPINVINIGGSTTNFIINTNNGIDNSNPYVGSAKTFLSKNIDVITAATSHKQPAFRSNPLNIITPNMNVNKEDINVSSILYNKLKNNDCVSSILNKLPRIQPRKVDESVTDYCNKIKTSLLYTKDSTQSELVALSSKRDEKTDICLKTTQRVTAKEWITYKYSNESAILPTNVHNKTISQSDVISTVSSTDKNPSRLFDGSTHETAKNQTHISINANEYVDKCAESVHQNNENLDIRNGNKSKRGYSSKQKIFYANVCGISNCSVRLMAEGKLNYHRSCHINNSKDLYCPECKTANFLTYSSLHRHLWTIHSIDLELYTCDICQHKTGVKKDISHHIQIHSNEKKYICEICSKAFINSKQLSTHRATHRKTMNFVCDLCNLDLCSARQLSIHKKTVHEKKKDFHCDLCHYSATTKHSLRLHIIRHIGTKHLKCPHCKFKTGDRNVLRRHRQRHTDEKTYRCKYCSYTCIQAASLKIHLTSKHSDNKNNLIYSCTQCTFTTFSEQKMKMHSSRHKDGTIKPSLAKSICKLPTKSKRNSKKKPRESKKKSENITPIVEADIVIEVTDQNSTSGNHVTSDDNTNLIVSDSNRQFNCLVENYTEASPNQAVSGYTQKENTHFFSNIINSLSSNAGNEIFATNNIHEGLYDLSNKIENIFDSNSESTNINNNACINKVDVGYDSSMTSCNPTFNSSNHQNNCVVSNIDTDDNDTYYANYDSNLVINEEVRSSENTNFNLCVADNATDGLPDTNHLKVQTVSNITTAEKSNKTEGIQVKSNIFVKDILDLAASHIKTIPPNIYASDIQKSASHTPIILINPKTQTNNRIMGANVFSSNIINPSYSENSGSSQMLHIPLQTSNMTAASNSLPRKKPKISVKSNLILKGPDRLDNFNICSGESIEYNINNPLYSLDNYNLPLDFIPNSQISSQNSNMNCGSDLLSKDLYNSEHNYLSNYLLNSDFPLPNIQAPIMSNNTTIIQNDVNAIQTIPLETNLTDMSDVKLENKPYLSNQSETLISNMMGNTIHNDPNMFYDVPIHVPIKFEQKMDMLSSYSNQNNTVFQDNSTTPTISSPPVVEEMPQTFENINTVYNQSLYPFEDNYYFENDFITETLDGQEIIVLNDTWSDVKSTNNEREFDQSLQANEMPVKEKPRIISEVHITGNTSSNLSKSGDVKKIGLPFEFPLIRNTFNDFPIDQQDQDVIFDLEEQY